MQTLIPAFLISFLLFSIKIYAQWVPTSNFPSNGGGVFSLAASQSGLLAGTSDGGIFLTSNNGIDWNEANSGLTNLSVYSIAVTSSHIFAGTFGGGIFRTSTANINWNEVNSGLTGDEVYSIVISGSNIFAGTNEGFFFSSDNGENWEERNSGLPNSNVRAIIISGSNIFAGAGFSVYISSNNGMNWTEVNSGLPSNLIIYSLTSAGNNIFAGTDGGGVYFSNDNGSNWNAVNSGLADNVIWSLISSGSNIFAGTDDGVFYTTNNGTNWINTDFAFASAYALAASETDLFAGGGFGRVYRRPLSELITNVEPEHRIPSEFYLYQNYPNPFNPSTKISFEINRRSFISLIIYDMLGSKISTLINEKKDAGFYEVNFDAYKLPGGVYFYQLKTDFSVRTKKMIFLK